MWVVYIEAMVYCHNCENDDNKVKDEVEHVVCIYIYTAVGTAAILATQQIRQNKKSHCIFIYGGRKELGNVLNIHLAQVLL